MHVNCPKAKEDIAEATEARYAARANTAPGDINFTPILEWTFGILDDIDRARHHALLLAVMTASGLRKCEVVDPQYEISIAADRSPFRGAPPCAHLFVNKRAKRGVKGHYLPLLYPGDPRNVIRARNRVSSYCSEVANAVKRADNNFSEKNKTFFRSQRSFWPVLAAFSKHIKMDFSTHSCRKVYAAVAFQRFARNRGFRVAFVKGVLGLKTERAAAHYDVFCHDPSIEYQPLDAAPVLVGISDRDDFGGGGGVETPTNPSAPEETSDGENEDALDSPGSTAIPPQEDYYEPEADGDTPTPHIHPPLAPRGAAAGAGG